MRDQFHSGKWSEYEVQAKRLCKHEVERFTYGEAYQSPVPTPISEKPFERIKSRVKGHHDRGHYSVILDVRKGQSKSMMFYLKLNRYAPEVQEALTNLPEEKKYSNDKNEEWRKKFSLTN